MRIKPTAAPAGKPAKVVSTETWMDQEVKGCHFNDVRLAKRFRKQMADGIGESVPSACQDWANTKAAYRFFANADVSEDQIMAGHFQATRDRLAQAGRKILMLHDTCEFSFQREQDARIGLLGRPSCGRDKNGRLRHLTVRGILMHSSLTVTTAGLPLGLGGYLARATDPPPGNMVIWRGLSRLNDIQLGFALAAKLMGN